MAQAVADAASTGEHLLVQAGTGTGKSLAYLIPAILVEGPVVVSTATLALQSQLVNHDLPRLVEAITPVLGRTPTFALLKGRHHYVCLARLDSGTVDEPDDALFDMAEDRPRTTWLGEAGRLGKQIQRLRDWAMETESGDRDELDPGVDDTAWRQVSMPARECIGANRCPYGAECFAEASRARAREADIVVTNHSLLAVDMLAERHIVPEHRLLVVDEAHELADRVSSASQAELTAPLVERTARRVRTLVKTDDADAMTDAADELAIALTETPQGRITGPLSETLRQALTVLDAAARRVLSGIGEVKSDDPDPIRKQQAKTVVTEISETAQRLLAESEFDVAWIERNDRQRLAIVVAPLSVAGTLRNQLFSERTVVAASATLALGGNFDTMARALGLPPAAPNAAASGQAAGSNAAASGQKASGPAGPAASTGAQAAEPDEPALPWRSLDVGSPFDYPKQGILYVAAHLPRPTTSGLSDQAAEELLALVQAIDGRTLGLFSSRRAAERAAEVLRDKTDLPILLQGEEALPLLVRQFRQDQRSCLFGVMSLWQGVDVPGDACQLVVIDRLPFPRPDEPLSAARSQAVDAAGGSGFAAVSVPIAAVRLAQGAGRLIRTSADRGVVAVLDSRLETARGYGSYLRRTLPPFWYTTRRETVLAALERLATPAQPEHAGSRPGTGRAAAPRC